MTLDRQIRAAAFALALLAAPAGAGVREGVEAWAAGAYDKAVAEWRAPAEAGDADAQFNLGQAFKLGRGVPINAKLAQEWFLKAARQGHAQAQANAALLMYQGGEREAAMPWIRRAAERGEPRAQFLLATALFNGDLAPRDWPRAYALMSRAKLAGLPQASSSLEQMDSYLSSDDKKAGLALADQLAKGGKAAAGVIAGSAMAAPATPGSWRVQLGAYGSQAGAEKIWAELSILAPLAGVAPSYEDTGKFVRLRAAPFAGRAEALRACDAVKAVKRDCLPMAPSPAAAATDGRPAGASPSGS